MQAKQWRSATVGVLSNVYIDLGRPRAFPMVFPSASLVFCRKWEIGALYARLESLVTFRNRNILSRSGFDRTGFSFELFINECAWAHFFFNLTFTGATRTHCNSLVSLVSPSSRCQLFPRAIIRPLQSANSCADLISAQLKYPCARSLTHFH